MQSLELWHREEDQDLAFALREGLERLADDRARLVELADGNRPAALTWNLPTAFRPEPSRSRSTEMSRQRVLWIPTGRFSISVTATGEGAHLVVATYNGDADFTGSASPAVPLQVTPAGIPTLSEWMLLMLALTLAIVGALAVMTR